MRSYSSVQQVVVPQISRILVGNAFDYRRYPSDLSHSYHALKHHPPVLALQSR